jgi:murein DD-endopeptidase MepM/ murein hydrolase activator NlpD
LSPMKLPKTVRQCLATAMMTSTLLESYKLPLLSASRPSSQTVQPTQGDRSPSPDATEQATPANPEQAIEPVAASASTASSADQIAPSVALPTAASGAAPASSEVHQPSGVQAVDSADVTADVPGAARNSGDRPSDSSHPATEEVVSPEAVSPPVSSPAVTDVDADQTADSTSVDPLTAARQMLAQRLAEILERDQPLREAQLRQNLVASALHYAQVGAFDQAKQTAQNPALPPEVQADTLAKIEAIALLSQLPVTNAAVGTIAAAPGTPTAPAIALAPRSAPTRWVLPSSPESGYSYPYFSDRCLLRSSIPPLQTLPLPSPARPEAASTAVSAFKLLSPATNTAGFVKAENAINLTQVPEKAEQVQKGWEFHSTVQDGIANPDQIEFKLDRMIDSLLSPSLQELGISMPLLIPSLISLPLESLPLQSALNWQNVSASDFVTDFAGVAMPIGRANSNSVKVGLPAAPTSLQVTFRNGAIFALTDLNLPPVVSLLATTAATLSAVTPLPDLTAGGQDLASVSSLDGNCSSFAPGNFASDRLSGSAFAHSLARLGMSFPLPIPAAITSIFGWRMHPITGDRRFHAGVDLGAPLGTPVLAARSGQVIVADHEGGYGLTVVLQEDSTAQRNLYAHLSAIAVQPGTWVRQGTVIGWVGNTGNSTGPHLHFESQLPISGGWRAVDPLAATAASNP